MGTTNAAVAVVEDFKRDQVGRPIVSKERWAELVEGYRSSGLTLKQYAKNEGHNWLTLAKWSGRLRPERKKPKFAEVKLPAVARPEWSYEVSLPNGLAVRASSAQSLVELLELIRK